MLMCSLIKRRRLRITLTMTVSPARHEHLKRSGIRKAALEWRWLRVQALGGRWNPARWAAHHFYLRAASRNFFPKL
jgi:hypothetical protein